MAWFFGISGVADCLYCYRLRAAHLECAARKPEYRIDDKRVGLTGRLFGNGFVDIDSESTIQNLFFSLLHHHFYLFGQFIFPFMIGG